MAGDIFLLGTTSWMIRRVESGVVRVQDAHGHRRRSRSGTVRAGPYARTLARGRGLADHVDERDDAGAEAFLQAECGLDRAGAEQAVTCVRAGRAILGNGPHRHREPAERFFDERRRDATDPARAVRRADQPRVGPRAAQEVLPHLQHRAPSCRNRQRHSCSRWASSTPFRSRSSSNT